MRETRDEVVDVGTSEGSDECAKEGKQERTKTRSSVMNALLLLPGVNEGSWGMKDWMRERVKQESEEGTEERTNRRIKNKRKNNREAKKRRSEQKECQMKE